jgi:hypothetical protein
MGTRCKLQMCAKNQLPGTQHQRDTQVKDNSSARTSHSARDMRPLAKTNTLASVLRTMHCPKPYSYRRAAAPIIVSDSCHHRTAHPHILCDTTAHHSQQTTANCPQHQGCVAAVAVSQPFVSRALRSVHFCKQQWGIARTALQA